MKPITKTVAFIAAMVMSISSSTGFANSNQVFAADDTEILASQLSMPIVSIDTLGNSVNTKNSYTSAKISIYDEEGTLSTDSEDISIRLRGNITLNVDKKSYRFKFSKKANPLGLGDGAAKSWNLVANHFDASLLRNMTAYHLGDMLDNMPYTPNARSVEVYVNGNYQGVYLLCEAINVAKSRIAITENPDLIEDNGYLIEMTRYAEENPFTVDCCTYEVKSDVSEDETIAVQQIDYISDYTEKALHALKGGDKTEIEQYIDVPSLVDNCIAYEICKDVDAGWDSYYLSKDAGGKLTFHPMWDYDLALGNNTEAKGIDNPKGLGIFDVTDSAANSNPWLCYAMNCDWIRTLIKERWTEKYSDIKTIPAFVTSESAAHQDSYDRNFTKWKLLGKAIYNEPEEEAALTTHQEHAQYLADWLTARIAWLDAYYKSDDFAQGVFLDEKNAEIDTKNAINVSSLMMWGITGEVDVDSPGFAATAGGGFGQALATGLMIQKDQKYILSFDYSGASTATINYRLQANHDGYTGYQSDSVAVAEEVQHYEKEFTATTSDFNCALAFDFKGSGSAKIEHLSLIAVDSGTSLGDVNEDGEFNISDVVLLQKWLLAVPNTELKNWKAADFCTDKRLNVFDLCLMKRELLRKMGII